jgi:flavorubredoxin
MTSTLPRELAPGIHWLGDCLEVGPSEHPLHSYDSVYLVAGERCCALVDGGHPQDVEVVEAQLEDLLASGLPELRYLFATHTETPHSAGFGRLLERYPNARLCGEVSDLHLVFPEHADRLVPLPPGAALDLGGTHLQVLEAAIRDYASTLWAFDTRRHVLFTSDGFAYSHHHRADQCGRVAEEVPGLDIPDMTALFAELALYWTNFVDLAPYVAEMERVLVELDVRLVAPAHGLPVTDLAATLPLVRQGLLRA